MAVIKIFLIIILCLLALLTIGMIVCALAAFMLSSSLSQAEEKLARELSSKNCNITAFKSDTTARNDVNKDT